MWLASAALTAADAIEGPRQARFIAFYTTSFTIGSALSFVGAVLDALGGQSVQSWLVAFAVMGLPGIAGILMIRRERA